MIDFLLFLVKATMIGVGAAAFFLAGKAVGEGGKQQEAEDWRTLFFSIFERDQDAQDYQRQHKPELTLVEFRRDDKERRT